MEECEECQQLWGELEELKRSTRAIRSRQDRLLFDIGELAEDLRRKGANGDPIDLKAIVKRLFYIAGEPYGGGV